MACGSILTGVETRADTAAAMGVSVRTLLRWERFGMPTTRVGAQRWHDPASVRAWLLTRERRHDLSPSATRRR
jgi:hypothetical protein